MGVQLKSKEEILEKLSIASLNEMQLVSEKAIDTFNEIVLLSPTGSGKTLAFLLPILEKLDASLPNVQSLIIVPTRELAIQIETVIRDIGAGFKVLTVYGGTPFSKDRMNLKNPPSILIGTPGRVADHFRRETFDLSKISYLVLDEFDKSLEIGFSDDMVSIIEALPRLKKKILTSATQGIEIPHFINLRKPKLLNFLNEETSKLEIKKLVSPEKDKLKTLVKAVNNFGEKPGLIFCNYKDSIERISDSLSQAGIPHGTFYGDMEQKDRERALIKFRNGTHKLLIATDLAARGIDVPEIAYLIHYHLPFREEEFIHRNGRTARMNAEGTAYVLQWQQDGLPHYIRDIPTYTLKESQVLNKSEWTTLFISGGRKDKISKGDIAGFFIKEGKIPSDDLGGIELKSDCAFVAIKKNIAYKTIENLSNKKIKQRKVKISEI